MSGLYLENQWGSLFLAHASNNFVVYFYILRDFFAMGLQNENLFGIRTIQINFICASSQMCKKSHLYIVITSFALLKFVTVIIFRKMINHKRALQRPAASYSKIPN